MCALLIWKMSITDLSKAGIEEAEQGDNFVVHHLCRAEETPGYCLQWTAPLVKKVGSTFFSAQKSYVLVAIKQEKPTTIFISPCYPSATIDGSAARGCRPHYPKTASKHVNGLILISDRGTYFLCRSQPFIWYSHHLSRLPL